MLVFKGVVYHKRSAIHRSVKGRRSSHGSVMGCGLWTMESSTFSFNGDRRAKKSSPGGRVTESQYGIVQAPGLFLIPRF